jgi:hypothetical protein
VRYQAASAAAGINGDAPWSTNARPEYRAGMRCSAASRASCGRLAPNSVQLRSSTHRPTPGLRRQRQSGVPQHCAARGSANRVRVAKGASRNLASVGPLVEPSTRTATRVAFGTASSSNARRSPSNSSGCSMGALQHVIEAMPVRAQRVRTAFTVCASCVWLALSRAANVDSDVGTWKRRQ